MTFRRRLVVFFILIALVPSAALAGMLVLVSDDSREGKADARIAAGLETALALYEGQVVEARTQAERLASSPALARVLRDGDRGAAARFARRATRAPEVAAVEILDAARIVFGRAGPPDAIAFARVELTSAGDPVGAVGVSVLTAPAYAAELRRLTGRELVISREGRTLTATVGVPITSVGQGETADLSLPEGDFRARRVSLDADGAEGLLLLGPRKEGGLVGIGRAAAAILVGLMAIGFVLAYALARTLGGLHARVAEQAITDPLTGLWNRRRMDELLSREVDRASRFGHELTLVIVDVDDFKLINDRRGHPQGDAVLGTLGEIVTRTTRSIDVPARYGGDELALILVETAAEGGTALADRLREEVAETEARGPDGDSVRFTVSAGVATLPDAADSADTLIEAADKALLRAKRKGKNRTFRAPKRRKRRSSAGG